MNAVAVLDILACTVKKYLICVLIWQNFISKFPSGHIAIYEVSGKAYNVKFYVSGLGT